jgi:uncharacterized membrane protein YbhN (UPF0104 family)
LLVLFALWFGALALILDACLRICNIKLPVSENLVLNAYSTFLNYFLPGQGGVILRGLYLKARRNLPIYRFLLVTLIYYVCYAAVSTALLIGGVRSWWQTLLAIAIVSGGAYLFARYYAGRKHLSGHGLTLSLDNMVYLGIATCLQAICQVGLYWVELNSVAPGLKLGQIMSYTGAANFALFVSVTPGAIGIRESFLFFSQRLNHVTNTAIVGANVLDRSTYIVFLIVVFLILLLVRGKSIFGLRKDLTPDVSGAVLEQVVGPGDSK